MFDADAPKRLAKQLIALSAIEFVQEMFEVARAGVVRHVLTEAASRFPLRLRRPLQCAKFSAPRQTNSITAALNLCYALKCRV
jgi:hypothetical protein